MRICGGEFKGRILAAPSGDETRPTADAQREAVFNILHNSAGHESVSVLDLFAGTGALGLEALSWGAAKAVFVENSKKALVCLRKNLEICRVGAGSSVIVEDSRMDNWSRMLKTSAASFLPFDTVFCDPPYKKGLASKALFALEKGAAELFAPGRTVLVVEASTDESAPKLPPAWELFKERSKGSTQLFFYRRAMSA